MTPEQTQERKAYNDQLQAAEQRVREAEDELYSLQRAGCLYYTESREAAYVYWSVAKDFVTKFIDHCRRSKVAFLNNRHWGEVIGHDDFAQLFDPNTDLETLQSGYLGSLVGCKLYTDAFISPQARVGHTCEGVVFVPR